MQQPPAARQAGARDSFRPMGRLGEPDDIAWAAVYLASDEAKFVTGQVLSPNGGWHMSQ
jgi:NAD(P)-dependent dehydrogenase (short-subunit alcohol dehydrogenase family)